MDHGDGPGVCGGVEDERKEVGGVGEGEVVDERGEERKLGRPLGPFGGCEGSSLLEGRAVTTKDVVHITRDGVAGWEPAGACRAIPEPPSPAGLVPAGEDPSLDPSLEAGEGAGGAVCEEGVGLGEG